MQDYTSTTHSILLDGTYAYAHPYTRAAVVFAVEAGQVSSYSYAGDFFPAHRHDYLNGEGGVRMELRHCANMGHAVSFTPAPAIGNARGQAMHKALARAGYNCEHHALASGALGFEVTSLATLTEAQARFVLTVLTRKVAA